MKLKIDANGNVVVQDGKPVYTHDDGKEVAFDAAATVATISRLNGEAKGHRERAEAAEGKLKAFDGIGDAEAARKALATIANLDAKKLVDAGEVEKIKAEVTKALEAKYQPHVERAAALERELREEKIGGAFSRSKTIAEKFAIPPDLVQAKFGGAFELEGGKIVAKDQSGNRLYSRANPGELAGFDEAIEMLVDSYPHKDHILKGSGASGGGAQGAGASQGGKRAITRAQFDQMDAAGKAATAAAVREGKASLTE